MMHPIKIPDTKNKFHSSFFQSYLKKGILAGIQAAHICRNDEEIPKDLLPISNNGTINPINGPAIYQGQGEIKIFKNIIIVYNFIFENPLNSDKYHGRVFITTSLIRNDNLSPGYYSAYLPG